MARYDLLSRFGTEQALREALAVSPDLARYASGELASLDPGILARDHVARMYAGALRRALGLDTASDAEIEAAHEQRMQKIMTELNAKRE